MSDYQQLRNEVDELKKDIEWLYKLTTELNHALPNPIEDKRLLHISPSEIALALLKKQKYIFGKVSDKSDERARNGDIRIITLSNDKYPFRSLENNLYWVYCVPYDNNGNEITEMPE